MSKPAFFDSGEGRAEKQVKSVRIVENVIYTSKKPQFMRFLMMRENFQ